MERTKPSVNRIIEAGERKATVLEQDTLRVLIDDEGGMVPELSSTGVRVTGDDGHGRINAHWLPWFRSNSGEKYIDARHGAFWKGSLSYHTAGTFPCIPNFGSGCIVDGVTIPDHGWSANQTWQFISRGIDEASGAAWALSIMESPDKAMPLSLQKIDAVIPGQPVHYTSITVKNSGGRDIRICAGFHNTLGAPFLQAGCLYSAAAAVWATPPRGSGFDTSARLTQEAEFGSLVQAPLAKGGVTDISRIPGPIGYTDFATGAIPAENCLGWSALVNPLLKMTYICFFTGPGAQGEDDIILRYNDLWMQYGGRPFTPWAPYDGGTDLTYCLGTENTLAAYANGLEYSLKTSEVLGAPTTAVIPAGGQRVLRYGSLFTAYSGPVLDKGITSISAEETRLIASSQSGESWSVKADPSFTVLKGISSRVQ
jgi:hypothetical protein